MFNQKPTDRKSQKRRRKATRQRTLRLESLDRRQLMAADLGVIDDGVQGELFSYLQSQINSQVFRSEAPLVGGQLAEEGSAGQFLTDLQQDLSQLVVASGASVADTQAAIEAALVGKIGETGITVTGDDGDTEVRFQIPITLTRSDKMDLDLGLGEDSVVDVLLGNEDAVDVDLNIVLNLEFGVRELADGSSQFFIVTANQGELTMTMDATLNNLSSDATGRMGVFVGKFASNDDGSSFSGTYTIDLADPDNDGLLIEGEFGQAIVVGKLSGSGVVNLDAEGSFLPLVEGLDRDSLFNLAVTNKVTVAYEFDAANTSGRNTAEQVDVDIEFSDTRLDLGTFYRDFIDPILTGIRDVIMPVKPIVDFLSDPIPGLSEFTELTFLDVATRAANAMPNSPQRDEALRKLGKAKTTIGLMNRLLDYKTPGTAALGDTTRNLGSVKATFVHGFGEQEKDTRSKTEQLKSISFTEPKEAKSKTSFEAEFEGDVSLPLLSDPRTLIGLLSGNASTSLFTADLNFDLSAIKYEYTVPIPALAFLANGEFKFELSAGLDLGFGFDAQGISDFTQSLDFTDEETLKESKLQNEHFLDRGFYVDDNNVHQIQDGKVSRIVGQTTELPEVFVRAKASVGGSLGPDWKVITAKAGLLGTLSIDVNLDLNDLPDTLPTSEWVDPYTPTRSSNQKDWTYDGHLRMDEIQEIIDYDPATLVNASGQLIVGADAFAEVSIVGIELLDWQTTLAEIPLMDFDIASPDDAAIIEKSSSDVVLGEVDANGVLTVFAGSQAGHRAGISYAKAGAAANENFRVRSLGETENGHRVQVVYWFNDSRGVRRSFNQTFTNVTRVELDAGDGDDQLAAEPGTQVPLKFTGGTGNDVIIGGRAADILLGSSGDDDIRGGGGDDRIEGGDGADTLFGGTGHDSISGGYGEDDIFGEAGNDEIWGDDQVDTLRGGLGNDILHGGRHNDVIYGEEGADSIYGDSGDDWLHGDSISNFITQSAVWEGAGGDSVHGGSGADMVIGGYGNDALYGDDGADSLYGEAGNDYVDGGSGADSLWGDFSDFDNLFRTSTGNDELHGGAGNDWLRGGPGNDKMYGGADDDVLYGQSGNDTLDGEDGNDTVYGDNLLDITGGADNVRGGNGNDELHGGPGNDNMNGDAGNDKVYGEAGHDVVRGGSGNDYVYGDAVVDFFFGWDTIYGDDGDDHLYGGWGDDTLYGGNHNDKMYGNAGQDRMYGGAGNDYMEGGWGSDRLYGESGNDTMYGGLDNDMVSGGSGNDYVHGGWGHDTLYGGSGSDRMYGDLGNDTLRGGSGNDTLDGGWGGDRLYGDSGNDNLHGGAVPLFDQDFARDYLHGGSGWDTINVSWYWFFGWHKEDTAVSGERIV